MNPLVRESERNPPSLSEQDSSPVVELPRFTAHPADSYIIRGKSADMECEVEGADKGGIVPLMRIDLKQLEHERAMKHA